MCLSGPKPPKINETPPPPPPPKGAAGQGQTGPRSPDKLDPALYGRRGRSDLRINRSANPSLNVPRN